MTLEKAVDNSAFLIECTPGYYNGEGTRTTSSSYAPGPDAFHRVISQWCEGDMSDVLVPAPSDEISPSDHRQRR